MYLQWIYKLHSFMTHFTEKVDFSAMDFTFFQISYKEYPEHCTYKGKIF